MEPSPPFRRYATTPTDWEIHKPMIIDLYVKQNMSLGQVINVMAQTYDFVATPSMYKKRITYWGLRKNISKKEVAAMLRVQQARKDAGKRTDFFVGQKKLDIDKYVKRHDALPSNVESLAPPDIAESDIIVRTPSPELPLLRSPPIPQLPDEVFHLIRDYVSESFETGRWLFTYNLNFSVASTDDQSDFALTSIRRTFSLVTRVLQDEPQDSTVAFVLLRSAFDNLPRVLHNESPLLFLFLLDVCERLNDRTDLANTIRHRLYQLCENTLGSRHSLTQILDQILQSKTSSSQEALMSRVYDMLLDVVVPVVGPDNLLSIQLYMAHIWHSEGTAGFLEEKPHPTIQRYMMSGRAPIPFRGSKCALALDLCYPSLQNGKELDAEQHLLTVSNSLQLLRAVVDYSQAFSSLLVTNLKLNQGSLGEAHALYTTTEEISHRWGWDRSLLQCLDMYSDVLGSPPQKMHSMMSLSAIMDPPVTPKVTVEIDRSVSTSPSLPGHKYEIMVFCACQVEADAVLEAMDQFRGDDHDTKDGSHATTADTNTYILGTIEDHNIILAHVADWGTTNSTAAIAKIRARFPDIRLALAVGVCGGSTNTYLGDVVLSTTVVQFSHEGHREIDIGSGSGSENRFDDSQPKAMVDSMLSKFTTHLARQRLQDGIVKLLQSVQNDMPDTKYPGIEKDRLYNASYLHKHSNCQSGTRCEICNSGHDRVCKAALMMDCDRLGCDHAKLVSRAQAEYSKHPSARHYPDVHFGKVASINRVPRSGQERDQMMRTNDVIAFEMEGAGLSSHFPTIIVKGVCDYADGHKSKAWTKYAATTAAAAMKILLRDP